MVTDLMYMCMYVYCVLAVVSRYRYTILPASYNDLPYNIVSA